MYICTHTHTHTRNGWCMLAIFFHFISFFVCFGQSSGSHDDDMPGSSTSLKTQGYWWNVLVRSLSISQWSVPIFQKPVASVCIAVCTDYFRILHWNVCAISFYHQTNQGTLKVRNKFCIGWILKIEPPLDSLVAIVWCVLKLCSWTLWTDNIKYPMYLSLTGSHICWCLAIKVLCIKYYNKYERLNFLQDLCLLFILKPVLHSYTWRGFRVRKDF